MLAWTPQAKGWYAIWDKAEVEVYHNQKIIASVRRSTLAVNGDMWFSARKWDDLKLAVEEVWQALAHFKKTGQTPVDRDNWTPEKIRGLLKPDKRLLKQDKEGYVPAATDLEEGSWECEESPTHTCWYDQHLDPAWDDCLFCGEPDERK